MKEREDYTWVCRGEADIETRIGGEAKEDDYILQPPSEAEWNKGYVVVFTMKFSPRPSHT